MRRKINQNKTIRIHVRRAAFLFLYGKMSVSGKTAQVNTLKDPLSATKTGKIKKKYRGKKKKIESAVKLPQTSEDFSSNWKKLSTSINKNETKKKTKPVKKRPSSSSMTSKVEKSKPNIWFDDVDPELLDPEDRPDEETVKMISNDNNLVKEKSFKGLTKSLAMDCEMVGVGYNGKDSILARVSIVNQFGHCVYDKYVKVTEKVTDYRTKVSGIRPQDLENGEDFKVVQKEVSDIMNGRVLVGHSIKHDLKVLFLDHPRKMIRDTSAYKPFRKLNGGKTPGLKSLTARLLGVSVQVSDSITIFEFI